MARPFSTASCHDAIAQMGHLPTDTNHTTYTTYTITSETNASLEDRKFAGDCVGCVACVGRVGQVASDPIQASPESHTSFFQIGTVCLRDSIAKRADSTA